MAKDLIPQEVVENKIFMLRGKKVMLDNDLARLYGVATKALNRAVRRNIERFPGDFMFQLTMAEANTVSRCQIGTLKQGQNIKYLPYVFTENGVAMLSSVLNSRRAIDVNIQIMRTFSRMRSFLALHSDLQRKLEELEKKYDAQFKSVFDAIKMLMAPPEEPDPGHRKIIGFKPEK
ncbi:MAG TPA: DNA-binding protein [Elusimicrobia bacterium]|nr:DNA-binding protein [Elusimicrobiota bacterium]